MDYIQKTVKDMIKNLMDDHLCLDDLYNDFMFADESFESKRQHLIRADRYLIKALNELHEVTRSYKGYKTTAKKSPVKKKRA